MYSEQADRGHMKKDNMRKFPQRFTFILNPYKDTRLSACPICLRPTHMRKFALLIHIEKFGFLAPGKTCRYCSHCELIMAHQDELEDELVHSFETRSPDIIGNPYLVFGTVEIKWWKQSLGHSGESLSQLLEHVTQFKSVRNLKIKGGWQPVKKPKPIK